MGARPDPEGTLQDRVRPHDDTIVQSHTRPDHRERAYGDLAKFGARIDYSGGMDQG